MSCSIRVVRGFLSLAIAALIYVDTAWSQEFPDLAGTRANTTAPVSEDVSIEDIVVVGKRDAAPLGLTILAAYGFDSDFDLQAIDLRYGSSDVVGLEYRYMTIDVDGLSGNIGQSRFRLKKDLYAGAFSATGRVTYTDQEDSYTQIAVGSALRFQPIGIVTPMAEIDYVSRDLDGGPTEDTLSAKVVGGFNLIPGVYTEAAYYFEDDFTDEGAFELFALKKINDRFFVAGSWQERGLVVLVVSGSF